MARLFLTNIDLNTNELQNAVVQNLSSAPLSGNKEGRIFYDVTRKALYLYTDGQWKPVASGGAAASSLELTGDVTGSANVDPATGKITLETTVVNNSVALGDDTTGDYVQQVHGTENQISVDYESGEGVVATVSLPSYIDIPNGEMHLRKTEYWNDGSQYGIITNNGNQFKIVSQQGDIVLDSHSGNIDATNSQIQTQKTELWLDGQNRGALLAHPSDGSLTLAATGWLHLESHGGTINIDSDSGYVNFNNNIRITNDGYIIAEAGDLTLNSDSGTLYINTGFIDAKNSNSEMHLRKTEYWNSGTQYGIITNNGNTFKQVATAGDFQIESNNGSINLVPDSGNVNVSGTVVTDSIRANNGDWLYITADNIVLNNAVTLGGGGTAGALYVKDANGNNVFYVDVPANETGFSGNVTIGGNLNVQGTLNAVNRTEINVEDNTIRLNTGFTGTPSEDAGIIVERGTANDTAIIWSEANDQWTLTNDGSNYYAIARKYVEVIGDASNTSFDVTHNLGTRDLTVMVRENNAEYNVVETDILMKDNNTVTIGFTVAPALNSYKVIIVG